MENILDVGTYEYKQRCTNNASIDDVLSRNNLYRHQPLSYALGDCLFNTFQVLFHFRYSFIQL